MPSLHFSLAYPLPADCAPDRVVAALQRYIPLITQNPYMVSYSRRPVNLSEIVDDPFFRDDGTALAAFEVIDRIVVVPGFAKKQVVIPCVMQRFSGGVRCRSFAAGGVKVWSTWRVMTRADAEASATATAINRASTDARGRPPTPPATPPATQPAGTEYSLVEEARVECSSLVKPFVSRSFRDAHIEILRKVIKDVMTEPERERMNYIYA